MNRKKSREYLLQLTYQMDITGDTALETFENFMGNEDISKENIDLEYIKQGLIAITDQKEKIDKAIEAQLVNWKLNRISKVNLAILRLAINELMFVNDIPERVAINEAIELCKKFSDNKSVSFINGVLDKIYKNI